MLIVIAALSLLGATASLLVPGGVLLAPLVLGAALLVLTGGLRGPLGAPARPADESQRVA
jgi:hypothetical protein